jgi:transposase
LGDWLHPYVAYDFTLTRELEGPLQFLEGYNGNLQAVASSGYDCIYTVDNVKEVACWIQARRYWHQARDNDPLPASIARGFIARLSQVEHQLRDAYPTQNLQGLRDFEAVARNRQEFAVPIMNEFKAWLDSEKDDRRILPKSANRSAFTYTISQWSALYRYAKQG